MSATTQQPGSLGEPPSTDVLASRIRHTINDTLDRYDESRTPEDAKAAAELAQAHRALAPS